MHTSVKREQHMGIGIDLGDIWSPAPSFNHVQLIRSAKTNPMESNNKRNDNSKSKDLDEQNNDISGHTQ